MLFDLFLGAVNIVIGLFLIINNLSITYSFMGTFLLTFGGIKFGVTIFEQRGL